jgi:hypothetical protein
VHHTGSNNLKSRLLKTAVHLADQVLLNTVGLHNGKSAFERHGIVILRLREACLNEWEGRAKKADFARGAV